MTLDVPSNSEYRRFDGRGGDGGVEAIYAFENGEIWGCQSKFMHKFDSNLLKSIEKSLRSVLDNYDNLTKYIICVPINLTSIKGGKSNRQSGGWQRLDEKIELLKLEFPQLDGIKIEIWDKSELKSRFIELDVNGGYSLYWFNELQFSRNWFQSKLSEAKSQAGSRYTPEIHVDTLFGQNFSSFGRTKIWYQRFSLITRNCRNSINNWYIATKSDKKLFKKLV